MKREILFEYGFESVNGLVKKQYYLHEIPFLREKCDVFNVLPLVYVRQFTGLTDKNGNKIFEGDLFNPDTHNDEVKNVIRWDDKFSKFVVDIYAYNFHIGEGSQEVYDNELSIVDTCDLGDFILEYSEIIGNIHEK